MGCESSQGTEFVSFSWVVSAMRRLCPMVLDSIGLNSCSGSRIDAVGGPSIASGRKGLVCSYSASH